MSIKEHPPQIHIPVLLEKTLEIMRPQLHENYLDLTAGYGGHARRFFEATHEYATSVLVDRDESTARYLNEFVKKGTTLLQSDFEAASRQLVSEGKTFDLILADLGVSSPQLDQQARGFSFQGRGPLDMRMDQHSVVTAEHIVNTYSKDELVRVITMYGEEPKPIARRIADAIVEARPLYETDKLADVILQSHRGRRTRIHPATRTFQALRIEVNDELGQVERLLPQLPLLLKPGGRVGVISFHSLEDRLIKRYFAEQRASGYEAELEVITKKPLSGADYDVHNPRSRSAKLRVAVKK